MDVVEVGFVVVELLGEPGLKETAGNLVGLAFAVVLLPGRSGFGFPEVGEVLPGGSVGHIVLVVGVALVTHHADAVDAFIGTLTET